jgi:hypothetical protein
MVMQAADYERILAEVKPASLSRVWSRDCDTCGYCAAHGLKPGPRFVVNGKERGLCNQLWLGVRGPGGERLEDLLKMVALHTEAGMTA